MDTKFSNGTIRFIVDKETGGFTIEGMYNADKEQELRRLLAYALEMDSGCRKKEKPD